MAGGNSKIGGPTATQTFTFPRGAEATQTFSHLPRAAVVKAPVTTGTSPAVQTPFYKLYHAMRVECLPAFDAMADRQFGRAIGIFDNHFKERVANAGKRDISVAIAQTELANALARQGGDRLEDALHPLGLAIFTFSGFAHVESFRNCEWFSAYHTRLWLIGADIYQRLGLELYEPEQWMQSATKSFPSIAAEVQQSVGIREEEAFFLSGELMSTMRKKPDAEAAYRKAIELFRDDPDDVMSSHLLALSHYRLGTLYHEDLFTPRPAKSIVEIMDYLTNARGTIKKWKQPWDELHVIEPDILLAATEWMQHGEPQLFLRQVLKYAKDPTAEPGAIRAFTFLQNQGRHYRRLARSSADHDGRQAALALAQKYFRANIHLLVELKAAGRSLASVDVLPDFLVEATTAFQSLQNGRG